MATAELIGLLCAGSSRYHQVGGGSGSDEQLSRAELAGLLAGISYAAMALALAKYALELDSERKLIAHVRIWAAAIGLREGWKIIDGRPCLANMAAMAVFEVVRPNRCATCGGTGVRTMVHLCKHCSGSGFRAVSGRHIAEAIGVDECNYRRTWKLRYESTLSYVQELDSLIICALRHADKMPGAMEF